VIARYTEPTRQLIDDALIPTHVVDAFGVEARQTGIEIIHADHSVSALHERRSEPIPTAQTHERSVAQHDHRRVVDADGGLVEVVHANAIDIHPARGGRGVFLLEFGE